MGVAAATPILKATTAQLDMLFVGDSAGSKYCSRASCPTLCRCLLRPRSDPNMLSVGGSHACLPALSWPHLQWLEQGVPATICTMQTMTGQCSAIFWSQGQGIGRRMQHKRSGVSAEALARVGKHGRFSGLAVTFALARSCG